MIGNRTQDDEIGTELSGLVFDNIHLVRNYLKLEDYDSTVVVLRISAASGREGGLTERQICEQLQFSRSTVNRILQRLASLGHIEAISNTSPRRFVHVSKRAVEMYGAQARVKRRQAHANVMARSVSALLSVFWKMQDSHFDQPDK